MEEISIRPGGQIVKTRVAVPGARCQYSRMAPAIVVSGLVKNFGTTRALNGLDLKVETGEAYGFLGPNGAGKTTTIRILLRRLRATRGPSSLRGGDPPPDPSPPPPRLPHFPPARTRV